MAISRADRARQFLPFDAVKGFQEALREKEREFEFDEKKELTEEVKEEISETLSAIEKGDSIEICFYSNNQYKKIIGKVQEINKIKKKIVLYKDIKINFIDILEIEKI